MKKIKTTHRERNIYILHSNKINKQLIPNINSINIINKSNKRKIKNKIKNKRNKLIRNNKNQLLIKRGYRRLNKKIGLKIHHIYTILYTHSI